VAVHRLCDDAAMAGAGGRLGMLDRKDREQAIADEFQDLAAALVNGLGLRVAGGAANGSRSRTARIPPSSERCSSL
jgi:hypothetical protein